MKVTDSFNLKILSSIHQILTHYSDNSNNVNSVINFMFLRPNLIEMDNYSILPESQHSSNHIPLTVNIFTMEEFIQVKQHIIIRNSEEEEKKFISELTNAIGNINTSSISNKETLKAIVQKYTRLSEFIWYKFS